MKDLFRNKKVLIGLGAVLIVVVLFSAIFVLNSSSSKPTNTNPSPTEEVVPTIMPSDIGFTLTEGADGKRVILQVENTENLSAIDYELSYISKGDIPRGAIGHIDIKTPGKVVKQEIVLGTCSDVCHYDTGVSNIKLVLKVTKTDGNVYQAEQKLELSQ